MGDRSFDQGRVELHDSVDGKSVLTLSYLSISDRAATLPFAPLAESAQAGHNVIDYAVGGLNEMRANFDSFLESKGETTNVCLPHDAAMINNATLCAFFRKSSCII